MAMMSTRPPISLEICVRPTQLVDERLAPDELIDMAKTYLIQRGAIEIEQLESSAIVSWSCRQKVATKRDRILRELRRRQGNTITRAEIRQLVGASNEDRPLDKVLRRMVAAGDVVRTARGIYALTH